METEVVLKQLMSDGVLHGRRLSDGAIVARFPDEGVGRALRGMLSRHADLMKELSVSPIDDLPGSPKAP